MCQITLTVAELSHTRAKMTFRQVLLPTLVRVRPQDNNMLTNGQFVLSMPTARCWRRPSLLGNFRPNNFNPMVGFGSNSDKRTASTTRPHHSDNRNYLLLRTLP